MKVKKEELTRILKVVEPGLSSKGILTQAESFIFQSGYVSTYNDMITVSHPLPPGVDLTGAVKAAEMTKLLAQLKEPEIDISSTDTEILVRTGTSQFGVRLETEIKLPVNAIGEPDTWHPLPEGLLDALKFCQFSVSSDLSKPVLTHVCLRKNMAISSDNYRITVRRFKSPLIAEDVDILVRGILIPDLLRHAPLEFGETSGWLHWKNKDDVIFSFRSPADAQYKDPTKFLKVEGKELKIPVTEMKAALEAIRPAIPADTKFPFVTVKTEKGVMIVSAKGDYAWAKRRMKVETLESIEFNINPDFMLDMLEIADHYIVGEKAIRIESKKEGFVHVTLRTTLKTPDQTATV